MLYLSSYVDLRLGKHRGFGFVEYEDEDDANQAIDNMHESELYGRVITVNLARTPARKPGEGTRAVWSDDAFLRQRIAEESSLPPLSDDPELVSFSQNGEP